MSAQILLLLMNGQYPFDLSTRKLLAYSLDNQATKQNIRKQFIGRKQLQPMKCSVKVKQVIKIESDEKIKILAKAYFLSNLKNKFLIRLQNIFEEKNTRNQQGNLHILYEHVPLSLNKYLLNHRKVNSSQQNKIDGIYQQIKKLAQYLGLIGVKSDLTIERIGLIEDKMEVKFFIGLDFQWGESYSEEKLNQLYEQSLNNIYQQLFRSNTVINNNTGKGRAYKFPIKLSSQPSTKSQNIKTERRPETTSTKEVSKQKTQRTSRCTVERNESKSEQKIRKISNQTSENWKQKFRENKFTQREKRCEEKKQKVLNQNDRSLKKGQPTIITSIVTVEQPKISEEQSSNFGTNLANIINTHKNPPSQLKPNKVQSHSEAQIPSASSISKKRPEKSKYEKKKYEQYFMTSQNTKIKSHPVYVKDFLQVLEDELSDFDQQPLEEIKTDQLSIISSNTKKKEHETLFKCFKNEQTETIQKKAKDAINNSLKVIQIFKKCYLQAKM